MPLPTEGRHRVVIDRVRPEIDGGRFPIKRTVGESVIVAVDAFTDGHDELVVELWYRQATQTEWQKTRLKPGYNDHWEGKFPVTEIGTASYTVVAWIDHFRSWRRDFAKRVAAGQDVTVDLQVGANFLKAALEVAPDHDQAVIQDWLDRIAAKDPQVIAKIAEDATLLQAMDLWSPREHVTRFERDLRVTVDRERARFSAWYEMFPRSAATQPGQHGTLRDVIARLPYVADMGFDVLYLPPIHPIGQKFRKGRNGSTEVQPEDVGSPWAIGDRTGGHKSIHPSLGTLDDFDALVAAAKTFQIDVALDIAFQASPDHPYVAEHPDWFRIRPDGTIQYAENPPKKYQDIYPFNFESADWQNLWQELKSVFEFWIKRGIRVFRVDNPHTKTFPFWEWCITELKQQWPDVIFLAEAFTRPKVMYRLAKLGYSQSYTYYAWRHSAQELTEYVTELTTTEVKEYFRPNFWPNTPDILTEELQQGGRPTFLRRLIMAATLSSNYGIYGPPYEHGWCLPAKAKSEEYINSEKFEVHCHDIARPDSLSGVIRRVNQIRKAHPALQYTIGIKFHPVDNERLFCYSKQSPDGQDLMLIVVNLDNQYKQCGFVDLDLTGWGIEANEPFQVHDLLADARYMWYGSRNYVELDPRHMPAHLFQIRRRVRQGNEMEYFQ
ncbi:DUF3416 domain-containing protein [bacterium]|nr:DUF3416 domain-containing protein [bacterium]